jgi:transcriptional regulator with XRE-family HTH domain
VRKRPYYDLKKTGENLKSIRLTRRLNVEDVRRFMELESLQSIYNWEAGKSFPSSDNLLALAILYEVSPYDLLVEEPMPLFEETNGKLIITIDDINHNLKKMVWRLKRYCWKTNLRKSRM